jgi:hypothetical protein
MVYLGMETETGISTALLPAGGSLPLAARRLGGWVTFSFADFDRNALGCLEQTGAQREET